MWTYDLSAQGQRRLKPLFSPFSIRAKAFHPAHARQRFHRRVITHAADISQSIRPQHIPRCGKHRKNHQHSSLIHLLQISFHRPEPSFVRRAPVFGILLFAVYYYIIYNASGQRPFLRSKKSYVCRQAKAPPVRPRQKQRCACQTTALPRC